ncbi:uncharacterized protein F5147DRAFT_699711 [Suillus discolor]|uniref:Uncharacterized protein n=1 Tax=Suillus discolor TaxID=1912936 RepID=A0A9P7F5D3_9AGAM|nr:uncharacterized protein F5147DRAFT_699711 [Suillus discolor]KAG2106725.1 hypothetical protein F5147DRAFT_699711 [Suillus discolor]
MSTPSGTIVRNLTFKSDDFGRETTILLVFDTDMEGLYDTIYPVVWKTFTFPARGSRSYNVTYSDDLAFSKANIGHDNLVQTSSSLKLKPGQKTTLSLKDKRTRFSPPVNFATGDHLTAENETGFIQDLAVGFYDPSKPVIYDLSRAVIIASGPDPMLFFKEVGNGKTEVLVGAIKSTAILEQDLHQLFRNTVFNLERNILTGRCKLTKTKP